MNHLNTALPEDDWGGLDRIDHFKNWSTELKGICQTQFSKAAWSLAGHGVLIESTELEIAKQLVNTVAQNAGMKVVHVGEAEIAALNFADFPGPMMLFLEPGDWLQDFSEEEDGDERNAKFEATRAHLVSYLQHVASTKPQVLVTCSEAYRFLPDEFKKVGVIDRCFRLEPKSNLRQAQDFITALGVQVCDLSLTESPMKLGRLLSKAFPDQRTTELVILALKRQAQREARKIGFADLANIVARGTSEIASTVTDDTHIRRVAIHEAGHVVVAVVDSEAQRIPEYCSLIPGEDFSGIMIQSYGDKNESYDEQTVREYLQKIRISLAGRAAEHLLLGYAQVSVKAASLDLRRATELAFEMFAQGGISPHLEESDQAFTENLAVVGEEITPFALSRIDSMTRTFLSKEYDTVMRLLQDARPFLEGLTEELLSKRVMDQNEIRAFAQAHLQK